MTTTSKTKGRGFGALARRTLTPQSKVSSMADFLSDPPKQTEPLPESNEVPGAIQSPQPEPIPEPVASVEEIAPPVLNQGSIASTEADKLDKRSIYFTESGSNALDDLEHYVRRLVKPALKTRIKTSTVVDQAIITILQDVNEKKK